MTIPCRQRNYHETRMTEYESFHSLLQYPVASKLYAPFRHTSATPSYSKEHQRLRYDIQPSFSSPICTLSISFIFLHHGGFSNGDDNLICSSISEPFIAASLSSGFATSTSLLSSQSLLSTLGGAPASAISVSLSCLIPSSTPTSPPFLSLSSTTLIPRCVLPWL